MNIEELKRLALAATPGPWATSEPRESMAAENYNCGREAKIPTTMHGVTGPSYVTDYEDWGFQQHDAEYMAAASPDMVLSLISQIERLTAEAELFAKHIGFKNIGLKLARKDALLRECLTALEYHTDHTLDTMDKIKTELGE